MSQALALLQFLVVGLGGSTLFLLVKTEYQRVHPEFLARVAECLASHLLWLFAIPLVYAAVGRALRGRISERALQVTGVVLCVILVVTLGGLNVLYLWW